MTRFPRPTRDSLWLAYSILGVAAAGAFLLVPSAKAQAVCFNAIGFSAIVAIVAGTWLHRPPRRTPWLLLGLGAAIWWAGDVLWAVESVWLERELSAVSSVDALYFAGYPAVFGALFGLARGGPGNRRSGPGSLIESMIVGVGAAVLGWFYLVQPLAERTSASLGERTVSIAYVTLDVLLIAAVFPLVLALERRSPSRLLLVAGSAPFFAVDIIWRDVASIASTGIDVWFAGELLAYVFVGACALHPSMRSLSAIRRRAGAPLSRRRLVLLVASALAIPAVLLTVPSELRDPADLAILASAAAVLSILSLVRLVGLVRAVEQTDRKLQAVVQASPVAIAFLDAQGTVCVWNSAAEQLTGLPASEVVGQAVPVDAAEMPEQAGALVQRALRGERLSGVEVRVRRPSGELVDVRASATPLTNASGEVDGVVAAWVDETERRQREQEIHFLATHDPLTGLPNRRVFDEALTQAERRSRGGRCAALLFLDLDNFKLVNDTVGHAAGDRLLVELAQLLSETLRPGDLIARLGGDEFAALIHDVGRAEAGELAERVLRTVSEHSFSAEGLRFALTASGGLCAIDGRTKGPSLASLADGALYAAKERGRNRFVFADEEGVSSTPLVRANQIATRIRDALDGERLVVALEPVVRLQNGAVDYHEALVRMVGEDGELVPPRAFLPAAEQFGLMPRIDRFVFQRVCQALRSDDQLRIFINLAASSLEDEALLDLIEAEIRADGLSPGALGFEIGETTAIRDSERALNRLETLHGLGCKLALDDFGASLSSFAELAALPVDLVKISDFLVRGLCTDPAKRSIVEGIVSVSRALGKQVIAEAVESEAAAKMLLSLGVEFGQGSFWGLASGGRFRAEVPPEGGRTGRYRMQDAAPGESEAA